jgi:hypothetical protein
MSPRFARSLVQLYPRVWRERYGAEFEALLEVEPLRPSTLLDLACGAGLAHFHHPSGRGVEAVQPYPSSVLSLVRKPSAFFPLIMSLCGLAMVVVFLLLVVVPQTPVPHDERLPARIFQLLLVGQLPFMAVFALRWFRQDVRAGATILGLQLLAIVLALMPPVLLGF